MEKLTGTILQESPSGSKPFWITEIFNVDDKLPDVDAVNVLAYSKYREAWVMAEYDENAKFFYSEDRYILDVSHWCHLPKPPQ
jgi:hypothetical protein